MRLLPAARAATTIALLAHARMRAPADEPPPPSAPHAELSRQQDLELDGVPPELLADDALIGTRLPDDYEPPREFLSPPAAAVTSAHVTCRSDLRVWFPLRARELTKL